MYSLSTFAISRLSNAEFVGFCLNLSKAITESTSAALGIETDTMTSYTDVLKKLTDQTYTTASSTFTLAMQEADTKRCEIFRRLRLRLEMVLYSSDNSALQACRETVETCLLDKYQPSVVRMAVQSKSGVLAGFVYDIQTKLSEDDVDALGIESDISALTAANNEFMAAYNSRSAERATTEGDVTKRLRAQMVELWRVIKGTVEFYANSNLADNATKATACQSFIGVVNVLLNDAKTRLMQRTAKSQDASDGGDEASQQSSGSDTSASTSGTSASSSSTGSSTSGTSSSSIPGVSDDVVFPGV